MLATYKDSVASLTLSQDCLYHTSLVPGGDGTAMFHVYSSIQAEMIGRTDPGYNRVLDFIEATGAELSSKRQQRDLSMLFGIATMRSYWIPEDWEQHA